MGEQAPTFNQIDEQGTLAHLGNIATTIPGQRIPEKIVPAEKLSDEYQQKLAAELAGKDLRDADEVQPRLSAWDQWKEDHPLSKKDRDAITQSVDKNIALTRMYGPTNFNVPKD